MSIQEVFFSTPPRCCLLTQELVASEQSLVQALVPLGQSIVLPQMADDVVHDVEPLVQVDVAVLVGIADLAQVPEELLKVLLETPANDVQSRVLGSVLLGNDFL